MAAALAGLTLSNESISVSGRPLTNRTRCILKVQQAERSLAVENTPVKAAGLFRDAILADPTYAPPYEGLAQSLMVKGDAKVVVAALKTALRIDPKLHRARFLLGTVAHMRGDYREALRQWRQLVLVSPDFPDAYARMSIAAYYHGDFAVAREYLREADLRKQNVPPQFRDLLREGSPKP